jgi:predicted kinase
MMLGHAGSGKSYFARHLSEEDSLLRLNADAIRGAIFGSREAALNFEPASLVRQSVSSVIDLLSRQSLSADRSVIVDASANSLGRRRELSSIAHSVGGISVVVWVKSPVEAALQRIQSRPNTSDQIRFSAEDAKLAINRDRAAIEVPLPDENAIEIDGTISFEQQYETFKKQLAEIEGE